MAGYDEPQKIVTGLQLLSSGVIDTQTLQENLDGLDNLAMVNERITREKMDKVLEDSLLQQAAGGDQKAIMAVVQIRKNPGNMQNILDKFFTAEKPDIPEPEAQLLEGQGPTTTGPAPSIQQVLGIG